MTRYPYHPADGPAQHRAWPRLVTSDQDPTDADVREAVRTISQTIADQLPQADDETSVRASVRDLVAGWANDQMVIRGRLPSPDVQADMIKRVLDHRFAMGELQEYLEDPDVEEIIVNGHDTTFIKYADGTRRPGPPAAASNDELIERIRMLGIGQGQTAREFSTTTPLINVALSGGDRLAATMAVTPWPCLCFRRQRLIDVNLKDLKAGGTVDEGMRQFLIAATRARLNIIITGPTEAGKTTLLRAMVNEIDPSERLVTLESEYELFLHMLPDRHRDVVPFEERQANSEGVGAITLHDLIPQCLRLNPSRIIVGEVRNKEIIPMLEAMNSGQEGSLCTIHANSAREIFHRILLLAQRSGLASMPPDTIHLLAGMTIDLVVHIHRDRASNARFVTEVIEVDVPADGPLPTTNQIFAPGPNGRAAPAYTPACLDTLVHDGGFDPRFLQRGPQ